LLLAPARQIVRAGACFSAHRGDAHQMSSIGKVVLRKLAVPECDSGATMPVVLADDSRMVFGYRLPQHAKHDFALFRIDLCLIHKFGYPNDEALRGHRYSDAGFDYYNAYEVVGSEWIDEMNRANAVSFPGDLNAFQSSKHFIFSFHDTTLEFVCDEEPVAVTGDGYLADAAVEEFLKD